MGFGDRLIFACTLNFFGRNSGIWSSPHWDLVNSQVLIAQPQILSEKNIVIFLKIRHYVPRLGSSLFQPKNTLHTIKLFMAKKQMSQFSKPELSANGKTPDL